MYIFFYLAQYRTKQLNKRVNSNRAKQTRESKNKNTDTFDHTMIIRMTKSIAGNSRRRTQVLSGLKYRIDDVIAPSSDHDYFDSCKFLAANWKK